MRNIIQDLPGLEVEAGHGLITSELTKLGADAIATDRHFPDESRYGFRNPLCVMTKLDAVSAVTQLPRPGLIWFCPELEHYTAEVLDAFQGDHFSYVGEADHGGTGYTRVPRHPGQQIPHRGLHLHTSIPQPPRPRPPLYHFLRILSSVSERGCNSMVQGSPEVPGHQRWQRIVKNPPTPAMSGGVPT